jgi:hypothetical protein
MEQVVGRWIDWEVHTQKGIWKWKDSILTEVAHGNAPGGQLTQSGILVCAPAQMYDMPLMVTMFRNHILKPERRSILNLVLFAKLVWDSPLHLYGGSW